MAVPIKLLELDPFDRRRYCECCGCPTLGIPEDSSAAPDWTFGARACDLCEWESAVLDEAGNVSQHAETAETRNDGLSLAIARANFDRFLSIYDPDDPPVWQVSAPDMDVLECRAALRRAYSMLPTDMRADSYKHWLGIRALEHQLRTALRGQRERDMDIDDSAER
jgi:hypothetical protein